MLVSTSLAFSQKPKICCQCKSKTGPYSVEAPAGFRPMDVCPQACTTNGSGDWLKSATQGACGLSPAVPPHTPLKPALSRDARAIEAIKWSIGHQGARIWKQGGDGDQPLTGQALFDAVIAPMGPGDDRDRVAAVFNENNHDLGAATMDAVNKCKGKYTTAELDRDMAWVCHEKNQSYPIHHSLEEGKWDVVRGLFSDAESDSPDIRNKIYCYSAAGVIRSVNTACKP